MDLKLTFQNLALCIMITALFSLNSAQSQTTCTVTSTSPNGPGSFLEAVDLANNKPGADIIEFTPGLQVDARAELPTLAERNNSSLNREDYSQPIKFNILIKK